MPAAGQNNNPKPASRELKIEVTKLSLHYCSVILSYNNIIWKTNLKLINFKFRLNQSSKNWNLQSRSRIILLKEDTFKITFKTS